MHRSSVCRVPVVVMSNLDALVLNVIEGSHATCIDDGTGKVMYDPKSSY